MTEVHSILNQSLLPFLLCDYFFHMTSPKCSYTCYKHNLVFDSDQYLNGVKKFTNV